MDWAKKQLYLEPLVVENLTMSGDQLCSMSKDEFMTRASSYVGDILWEHLETMQKGMLSERCYKVCLICIYSF